MKQISMLKAERVTFKGIHWREMEQKMHMDLFSLDKNH